MVCILPIFSGRVIDLASPERFSTVKVCASGDHGPIRTGSKGINLFSRVFNTNAHRVCVATPPMSNVQIKWDHNCLLSDPPASEAKRKYLLHCIGASVWLDPYSHPYQCFSHRRGDSYSFLCTRFSQDRRGEWDLVVSMSNRLARHSDFFYFSDYQAPVLH